MAFKSIKNLFIVDDEDEKKEEKKEQKKEPEKKQETKTEKKQVEKTSNITWKSSSKHNNSIPPPPDVSGKFNQKIFDSLTKAIANANLPGEDYLEFIQAIRAMKDIPLEESLKMQTVLATLSTKGLTIQKVYESADYYLKVLENEKKKFYGAFENMAKSGIEKKKKIIQDLEKLNKEKASLIAKLTEEINANNEKRKIVTKEMSEEESKIKSTENDFLFTYEKIANQIKNNIEKVKKL